MAALWVRRKIPGVARHSSINIVKLGKFWEEYQIFRFVCYQGWKTLTIGYSQDIPVLNLVLRSGDKIDV